MNSPRSAYIHIPFCHRRCFYCDFPVVPLGDKARGDYGPGSSSIKSYLKLLFKEIEITPEGPPLATLYIGGGTPSLLTPDQIFELLSHLKKNFGFQHGAEISLEIDPASFNQKDLLEYLSAGINRLSLGAQSFDNEVLKKIGRRHTFTQLKESCDWISQIFKEGKLVSWSLDLIQNLPDQKIESWKNQLQQAIDTFAPHLSVYDLSIEDGTVFDWKLRRGELNLPNHDTAADISRMTSRILKEAGFSRYEISNFALPGHASRHNRVYWSGAGWWGFGQGATSCPWGTRLNRPRRSSEYINWLKKQEKQGLDASLLFKNRAPIEMDELLLTGLRRREGVDFQELANNCGWDKQQKTIFLNQLINRWEKFIKEGLIRFRGERFCLSDPEGMDLSNQILVEMILWWDSLPKDAVALPNP